MSDFNAEQSILYQFTQNGSAKVIQNIKLTNQSALIYAKEYSLLAPKDVSNVQISQSGQAIPFNLETQTDQTKINFSFLSPAIGKNQSNQFTISYNLPNIAKPSGQLWEIILPGQQNPYPTISTYTLEIPSSWGPLAQSSFPNLKPKTTFQSPIIFNTPQDYLAPISLSFGKARIFEFKLSYFLENSTSQPKQLSIPIPPTTQSQQIHFTVIEPQPDNTKSDSNGNLFAIYNLQKNTQLNINVSGLARIQSNPDYLDTTNSKYLNSTKQNNQVWPNLNQKFDNPKDIYQYVTTFLTYNPNRAQDPKPQTVGELLQHPDNAICTDFTNLFISLSRSNNLSSRQIIGWALSEDQNANPLNQNADVLHSWVQYYDYNQRKWKEIDPTWGATSHGIDYFNSFDLNHLTFIIRGDDPSNPQPPGYYKQANNPKSVQVSLSSKNFQTSLQPLSVQTKYHDLFAQTMEVMNPNLNFYSQLPPLHKYEQQLSLRPFQSVTLANGQTFLLYNYRLIGLFLTFLVFATIIVVRKLIIYAKNP